MRGARHFRGSLLDAAAVRGEGRDGAVLVFRPPGTGSHGTVEGKTRMNAPDTLSREYNNRALVPEHPQFFARWGESSARDRKSTRLNSSHRCISYAVFCLKKKR